MRATRAWVFGAVVLSMPAVAVATDGEPARVTIGDRGLAVSSADGATELRLHGYLQLDGRWFADDGEQAGADELLVRRARPILEGRVVRFVSFRVMPDLGNGKSELVDAWVEARMARSLALRVGKFKPPIGLERQQSAANLAFVERGLPTALVPNRDLGIQLAGSLVGGRFDLAAGVFDGVVDGTSGDSDANDAKELVARLVWKPFAPGAGMGDLGLGLAASRGRETGSVAAPQLPTVRTVGQESFFAYRSDGTAAGTAVAAGERTRVAPQGWWYRGAFGVLAEWTTSTERVACGAAAADLESTAWQLQLSWSPSGDDDTFSGVAPRRPFVPADGGGAWLVALRATGFAADRDAFPRFADPAKSVRRAATLGASLSWNLTRGVRLMADFDWTRFDGGAAAGADRPDEKALFTRFQVGF